MATENLSVAAAFDLSYADLTEDQQRLFRRLGLHPGTDDRRLRRRGPGRHRPGGRPPRAGGPVRPVPAHRARATANLSDALGKGLLKIMSKMGVSTVASYTGAQIFEAIGLGAEVIDTCFAGTASRLGGVASTSSPPRWRAGSARAFRPRRARLAHRRLETGGEYQWRRDGEPHLFNPETVFKLQHATRSRRYEIFKEYTRLVDDQSRRLMTLRGLLRIRGVDRTSPARASARPVRIDEVEPVASHRAPVRYRCDVLRLDLGRGPPDPGDRDEPAGRPVQHRRGR